MTEINHCPKCGLYTKQPLSLHDCFINDPFFRSKPLLTELISEVEALKTTTSNYAIYKLGYSEAVDDVIKLLKTKLGE